MNEWKPEPPPSLDASALARMLRISGAVLLIASASTFMLQHWGAGNDLGRYAMLLGHPILLAGAAYLCGIRLSESRGARTFLALILAVVVPSFAVLGGLVYSQFHWEPIAALPHYARWVAPSPAAALLAVAGTLVVLVPLAGVAFVTLARKAALTLLLAFFATNLLLLIPSRDPSVIAISFGLSVVALMQLELRRLAPLAELRTVEGKIARLMPFVPPALLIGRTLHLYRPTALFAGCLALTAAYVIGSSAVRVREWVRRDVRDVAAIASAVLAMVGWLLCWNDLGARLASPAASAALLGLPCALFLLLVARQASRFSRPISALASLVALVTAVAAPLLELSMPAALACIVTGVGLAAWGAARRSIWRTATGGLVGLVGVALEVALAIQVSEHARWATLTAAGVLLILGAAFAERNKAGLSSWFAAANARHGDVTEVLVGHTVTGAPGDETRQ